MSEARESKQKKWGQLFLFISALMMVIATTYVFFSRPWHSIIEYALYFSVPLYTIVFFFLVYAIFKEGFKKELVIPLIFAPFSFTFGGIMVYGTGVLIIDVFNIISNSKLPINQKAIFSALFTLVVGILFFFFRKFRRSTYGFLEVLIGFSIGYNLVIQFDSNMNTETFYIPFLVSSVYLVVRGMDNLEHGLTKDPIDPWAKRIISMFSRP